MPTCACLCRHVPTCDINHDTSDSDHLDLTGMCWHVLICADMCRHVRTCETTLSTSDTNHGNLSCMHADVCWYVPACADMCRHDINHDTSYSDHLDLMLACVSTFGHADWWYVPICADTCAVTWYHVLICVGMCRHVPTCATTLSTSDTNHLKLILHAGMCQCRHVPACDINHDTSYSDHLMLACEYVDIPACAGMCLACWHVPTCDITSADMCHHDTSYSDRLNLIDHRCCRHVPICADMGMCQHLSAPLIPTIWLILHAGMCQHIWTCRHVLICADMCQHVTLTTTPLIAIV